MLRNYITLRVLVLQLLLLVLLQTSLAEEPSPSTTITTTSIVVVSTKWVVVTSAAGSLVTYTTSASATGSTIGITTIAGSIVESTQVASPSSSGENMAWEGQGFRDAVLNSTNQYRTQHEARALKWNQTLASYAQDHADSCEFKHTGGSYGENLAQGYATPALAIDGWANEEGDYNYEKRKFSNEVGHFTQLVWKNTTSVGCGATDCSGDGWLFVCEYYPPGNVIGEFGGNVGKPGQGEDGEPGMSDIDTADVGESDQSGGSESDTGGSAGKSVGGRLLVALVAISVLAGLYA